jgi:hypothetical protein
MADEKQTTEKQPDYPKTYVLVSRGADGSLTAEEARALTAEDEESLKTSGYQPFVEPPPKPIQEYPAWRYHKEHPSGRIVETPAEDERLQGQGWVKSALELQEPKAEATKA